MAWPKSPQMNDNSGLRPKPLGHPAASAGSPSAPRHSPEHSRPWKPKNNVRSKVRPLAFWPSSACPREVSAASHESLQINDSSRHKPLGHSSAGSPSAGFYPPGCPWPDQYKSKLPRPGRSPCGPCQRAQDGSPRHALAQVRRKCLIESAPRPKPLGWLVSPAGPPGCP